MERRIRLLDVGGHFVIERGVGSRLAVSRNRLNLFHRRQFDRRGAVQPNLPPAAQGPVDLHQAAGHSALGHGESVLLLHQEEFGHEHSAEVRLTALIQLVDQVTRLGRRGDAGA